ncbi:hypothetical protein GTY54_02780, partial [Streptomyces sp. SID625]|nr:hypothetical protein [Streptomyces sp. SID625]
FDAAGARALLAERLPAALVPVLAEVADLPVRPSGKIDRSALPWPVPLDGDECGTGGPEHELHGTAARLADL